MLYVYPLMSYTLWKSEGLSYDIHEHMRSESISNKLQEFIANPTVINAFYLGNDDQTKTVLGLFERLKDTKRQYEESNCTAMTLTASFRSAGDPVQPPKKVRPNHKKVQKDETPKPILTSPLDDYYERHKVDFKKKWKCDVSDDEMLGMLTNYDLLSFLRFRRNLISLPGGLYVMRSICEW